MDNRCGVPKCRVHGALVLRNKWVCDKHWLHLAALHDNRGVLALESQLARWRFPAKGAGDG